MGWSTKTLLIQNGTLHLRGALTKQYRRINAVAVNTMEFYGNVNRCQRAERPSIQRGFGYAYLIS